MTKPTANLFKFRGKNTFYFKRKRWPLESLHVQRAWHLTCSPGGGYYDGVTGDGEAWSVVGDRMVNGWMLVRIIKAGRWSGSWFRKRIRDI